MSGAENNTPLHVLQVRFALEKNRLIGKSEITLPPGKTWTVHAEGLTLTSVSALNGPLSFQRGDGNHHGQCRICPECCDIEYQADYPSATGHGREDAYRRRISSALKVSSFSGHGIPLSRA